MPIPGPRTNSGANLNREWDVKAAHPLYRENGKWYMPLKRFPGAYFDANGYVAFETREDYENAPQLRIGKRVNVDGGIKSMPGYVRMR